MICENFFKWNPTPKFFSVSWLSPIKVDSPCRQLTPLFTPAEREDYAARLPGTQFMPSSPAGRPFRTPLLPDITLISYACLSFFQATGLETTPKDLEETKRCFKNILVTVFWPGFSQGWSCFSFFFNLVKLEFDIYILNLRSLSPAFIE